MKFPLSRIIRLPVELRQFLASALDPVVSSAATFLVQGAVLLTASKLQFATFSLSYSYVTMGQAMLSALFGAPLVTVLGNLAADGDRQRIGGAILLYQLGLSLLLGLGGLIVARLLGISLLVAVFVALGLVGLSFRDVLRSILAARLRLGEALMLAIVFAAATTVGTGVFFLTNGKVTAIGGLAALAVGAMVAVLPYLAHGLLNRVPLPHAVLRQLTGAAAWSLPGVVVIWLQNNFYLTLLALNLDMNAVGEVSAARMVVMPLLIVSSGMLRLIQVKAARTIADRGLSTAAADVRKFALLALATGVILALCCFACQGLAAPSFLPRGHPHLLELAGGWMLFAGAVIARGVYSSLFQAMARYREIFILNIVVLPLVLIGIAVMPLMIGLLGAILPMAAGEALFLGLLVWRAHLWTDKTVT
jgi:O-antigen/teichoic acid export membrane protein